MYEIYSTNSNDIESSTINRNTIFFPPTKNNTLMNRNPKIGCNLFYLLGIYSFFKKINKQKKT